MHTNFKNYSHRTRGDHMSSSYSLKRRGEYEVEISESEVYLYFTLLFTSWRKHELRKRQSMQVFVKYKHVAIKNLP